MPRVAKVLSAKAVEGLREDGVYAVGGPVAGLYLQVAGGSRSWLYRAVVDGKRRAIGLGPYPAVSLADARQKAAGAKQEIENGIDPIQARQERKAASLAALLPAPEVMTFGKCAIEYIESHRAGWKSAKHAGQWSSTVETYAQALLNKPVADVTTNDVLAVLRPVWTTKTETAVRLRSRIELVLGAAAVAGHRPPGQNPAAWRGHLQFLLPPPRKVTAIEHHAALAHADLPAFWQQLEQQPGMGATALRFTILTAARSGETRGATWAEIRDLDGDAPTWVIAAERMKGGREHRVPLSPQAVDLLRALPRGKPAELVFPGMKKGTPLSDMTLTATLRRMKADVTAHGFRSTFSDWVAEVTSTPHIVAEAALAHVVGDKTEAAYRRGDLFAKRVALMAQWGEFVTSRSRELLAA